MRPPLGPGLTEAMRLPRAEFSAAGRTVEVAIQVHRRASVTTLAVALSEVEEVDAVVARDVNAINV